jgi:hypothetical protein
MQPFNYIQSFIVKPDAVNKAPYVFITSLDLYFKNKPNPTKNKSGINKPGVKVHICPFKGEFPVPDEELQDRIAVASWDSISALADASVGTKFVFNTPVVIQTNKYYGIVVVYEDEDFDLFTATQNETIINTTTKYSGSFGEGDGRLYVEGDDDNIKSLSDKDLKFELKIAKFTANTVTAEITHDDYEFFSCNNMSTAKKFRGGELVFQNFGLTANATVNTFFSFAGNVITRAANSLITGVGTQFTSTYATGNRILLTNSSNTSQQQIAEVIRVLSDTEIELEDEVSFSNTCWHRSIVTGDVFERDYVNKSVTLRNSTASNSTFRFVTNAVNHFIIANPGANYSNTNTITVSNGTFNAIGNIITNGSGNVVSVRMTSAGAGFPNASHSVVTITTSTGSAASLTPVISAPLKGIVSEATANLISIYNISVDIMDPEIDVKSTSSTTAGVTYALSNATSHIQAFAPADLIKPLDTAYDAKIISRSNELVNTTNLYNNDRSSLLKINLGVKVANTLATPTFYSPYLYENNLNIFTFGNRISSTFANTDSEIGRGNTQSKHITKKIKFANNAYAEDIRVYINAYRPANTKILVYAKIHNSQDPQAFDDKSWSPLEIKEGANRISARNNKEDTKEYTYGFPPYPESAFTFPGTGTTELGNTVILTTSDLTSNLQANDVVRIYNPLFSTTNYLVAPVDSVNSTAVILKEPVANNGLISSGIKIDKVKFKNVAYNNVLNDNIVRYYNTRNVAFDNYDSMSIKIVFLSDDRFISPEVDDIRVIGVSA